MHQIGLPWHWGWQGNAVGDVVNDLSVLVADPNTSIHEGKVFTCNIRPGKEEEVRCNMAKGMFVDTSVCTGCKACQVACKEWNGLDPEPAHFRRMPGAPYPVAYNFTGNSYDNTGKLTSTNWRHVRFIEQINESRSVARWLFMSDSCKHCNDAACLNVCPVEAIERTGMGNVVVRQDRCVGSRLCNAACPLRGGLVQREDPYVPQVHALQRPHPQRPGHGMLQGLPDGIDPVRRSRRAQGIG
ncbi:MAG: 4Fe-4S dicluster domain-containing protein [Comamonadaceae bacterium]|nr:4Fe-4S dicluster domain-containing protein [Comamonadaceae bacterium]